MNRAATRLTLCLLALAAGGCASTAVDEPPRQVLVPVVYVTDRDQNEGAKPSRYYGGDRGVPEIGTATIAVSTRTGDASPFADWRRWQARDDGQRKRSGIVTVTPARDTRLDAVIQGFRGTRATDTAIIYVHGFRRDFEAAALNFAELLYQTSPDALPILYSWPSTGNVFRYRDDVANLEWSNGTLQSVLEQMLEHSAIGTIHIVAHSLGSLAMLEAVAQVTSDGSPAVAAKFGQILLVSPDVGRERFEREYLPMIRRNDLRITIYAAENDVPLRTSRHVNKAERVGDARTSVPVYAGTETILVSDVVSILNSHDAHVEVAEVQADIAYLLNKELPADSRPTLERVDSDDGVFWRIRERR